MRAQGSEDDFDYFKVGKYGKTNQIVLEPLGNFGGGIERIIKKGNSVNDFDSEKEGTKIINRVDSQKN